MRNRVIAVAITAVTGLSLAAAAIAATVSQTLDVTLSSSKAGASTQVTVTFDTATDDGSALPAGTKTTIKFPEGLKFNYKGFKKCSKATLETKGPSACPKGSRIGSGSAKVTAVLGTTPLDISATVAVYNSGKGKIVLLNQVKKPIPITSAFAAKITKSNLTVTIPPLPIPGGANASIPRFKVTIDAKGYITNPKTCPNSGMWTYTALSDYEDGQKTTATDTVTCS